MGVSHSIEDYLHSPALEPLLVNGDAFELLPLIPSASIDLILTSPPYFQKRDYPSSSLDNESNYQDYLDALMTLFKEVYRVLKPSGSFWLSLGDSYIDKHLGLLPYRLAIRLVDEVGFVLRNQIIWNKMKGAPSSIHDRFRNCYEPFFFFAKSASGYYFNESAVRLEAGKSHLGKRGAVVTSSGVSGISYRRKVKRSSHLSPEEKKRALTELKAVSKEVEDGLIPDFRMVIRGENRVTNGDSTRLSGRAVELQGKGFYFLKYSRDGSLLGDVWDIVDSRKIGSSHYGTFPSDLVRLPIKACCPEKGIVLDPFVGTGTTCLVAASEGRKSIGIEINQDYLPS